MASNGQAIGGLKQQKDWMVMDMSLRRLIFLSPLEMSQDLQTYTVPDSLDKKSKIEIQFPLIMCSSKKIMQLYALTVTLPP